MLAQPCFACLGVCERVLGIRMGKFNWLYMWEITSESFDVRGQGASVWLY